MNKRRRGILAAMQPAVDAAMARPGHRNWADAPGLAISSEGATRELMIYGRIGGGGFFDEGIGAGDVAAALRELGPGPLDVRINSGGGDVFDGVAIHSLLARHSGAVTVHVDGLAASAASFISMAGDRIVMARNAFLMIHDGMTMTYGNADTHRRSAELLDKVSANIADIYAERAGEDVEHWRALMVERGEDGTWYTGQEALDAGLVDEITGGEETEARVARNLVGWRNALPERLVPLLAEIPEDEPEETPAEIPEEQDFRFAMAMRETMIPRGARPVKEMETA